jgi:hypothetical protein
MKPLKYATIKPFGMLELKEEFRISGYDTIKRDLNNACFNAVCLGDLTIWMNEEGLSEVMQPTLIIKNNPTVRLTEEDILINGPVVFTSSDSEDNTISLTNDAINILNEFHEATLGEIKVWIYENF